MVPNHLVNLPFCQTLNISKPIDQATVLLPIINQTFLLTNQKMLIHWRNGKLAELGGTKKINNSRWNLEHQIIIKNSQNI